MNYSKNIKRDGDAQPICIPQKEEKHLSQLFVRALNRNQILILLWVENNSNKSISSILRKIAEDSRIPLSTLKLNSKILKKLGLIEFGNNSHFKPARLTKLGKFVISIIKDTHLTANKNFLPTSDFL